MQTEYIPPTLTIDGVVFQIIEGQLNVLLIKRKREPYEGVYALPGGYNPQGESTTDALKRIIKKKAGVDLTKQDAIEQLYTFDSIGRDPRGHAVSVVYMVLGLNIGTENSSTTEDPQFFPITKLPKLAYDHDKIIKYAHERLKSKVGYSTVIAALLPKQFTLSQLQSTYEAVLGHELDKRNFRKRFLSFDALIDTNESYREGAHRPAKLYSLNTKLELLSSDLK